MIEDAKELLRRASKVPADVQEKIDRAKRELSAVSPKARECLEFWRGNQYVFRSSKQKTLLIRQGTLYDEANKPRHRVRQTRNIIFDIVRHEVSSATQRVPDYQVLPSTAEPEDVNAARIAAKVARFGYDAWGVRGATEKVVTYAVVTGEGFAWPYWDTTKGPVIDEDGTGLGEVSLRVYGPHEVGWEPGVEFEDSRWYIARKAMSVESVQSLRGFFGFKVTPDATTEAEFTDAPADAKLAMVTEYLERPSVKYPQGRRLTIVNGKLACPPETYPCADPHGNVADEPVLHRLSYVIDPDASRDLGLVEQLLDAQRTYNDANNKQIEWKNLAMMPQVLAPQGAFSKRQRLTDEPGAVFTYNPINNLKPEWREMPTMPAALAELKSEALADVQRLAAQNDFPQDASGKALQVLIERDQNARQAFLARLAEFHSQMMRHCLSLVAMYYSEPRLVKLNGRFGPENIKDFTGSQLRSQVDVTVYPDSIEPRTRQNLEQRVYQYAQFGWIPGEKAMDAIEKGTAANLVDSYELDVARAQRVIQKITAGPDVFLNEPLVPGTDPNAPMQVPSWMPRKGVDNLDVHRSIVSDYMKTVDYEQADDPIKEALNLYLQGIEYLKQQQQMEQMQQQANAAQAFGQANAAKPQTVPQTPSMAQEPGPQGPPGP